MNLRPLLLLVLIALIAAGLVGCRSTGDLNQKPIQEGNTRSFTADFASVVTASRAAVIEEGMSIDSDKATNDRAWTITAKSGVSGFSWGEVVRVVVE